MLDTKKAEKNSISLVDLLKFEKLGGGGNCAKSAQGKTRS